MAPITKPTLVLFTQAKEVIECPKAKSGIKVISIDDIRWKRRDIKTTSIPLVT